MRCLNAACAAVLLAGIVAPVHAQQSGIGLVCTGAGGDPAGCARPTWEFEADTEFPLLDANVQWQVNVPGHPSPLGQTANFHSAPAAQACVPTATMGLAIAHQAGTNALVQDVEWTIDVLNQDNDLFGLVGRYQDIKRFYFAGGSHQDGPCYWIGRQRTSADGGMLRLASVSVPANGIDPYVRSVWQQWRLVISDEPNGDVRIQLYYRPTGCPNDEVLAVEAVDTAPEAIRTPGFLGVGVWGHAGIYYRDPAPIDTCGPVCDLPASEWLETEFMPELVVAPTGFTTGIKDLFRIVFTYHRKYFDVTPSSGALTLAGGELTLSNHVEHAPTDCYDTYWVDVTWANLVTECARSEEGGASGFVVFTCKLEVDAKETLDPIRGVGLTREIHNELPFIVKFPKQASASINNLSAFSPVNVLAAVIRQEVSLDVSAVTDVDAKIRLFTSTQYPFRLKLGSQSVNSIPGQITQDSFTNAVDCVDPEVADVPNPTVNDALACSQEWVLDLQIDAGDRCDIDGDYQVQFQAECYPFFNGQTDCPLVKDDLGQVDDIFTVNFVIDSEDFCAQVVDEVDISAELKVYKDHVHAISATNFIQGQTAYYVATATSSKVTIVSLSVDDIDVDITGGANAGHYDFYTDGVANAANPAGLNLVVENSAANGNPAQAWFQHVVAEDPFAAPADGSADFDVGVTLNVVFKDAALGLLSKRSFLLQAGNAQQFAANVESSVSKTDDEETSSATALVSSVVGVASTIAALAL